MVLRTKRDKRLIFKYILSNVFQFIIPRSVSGIFKSNRKLMKSIIFFAALDKIDSDPMTPDHVK